MYYLGKCLNKPDLCQSQGNQVKPFRKVFPIEFLFGLVHKLRDQFLMSNNRAGDQLGEKGYERGIFQKPVLCRLPAIRIDDIRKLLKSKKTDSQRQKNPSQGKIRLEQRVDVLHAEIVVFKIKQKANIKGHGRPKYRFAEFSFFLPPQYHRYDVIHYDAA